MFSAFPRFTSIGILHLVATMYFFLSFNPEFSVVVSGFVASSLIAAVYFTPCFLILYLIRKVEIPIRVIFIQFFSLVLSIMLILLAEITQWKYLMMFSTSIFVLVT